MVVGGGHNGLVAATMLARAGRSVVVLERREQLGGAAVSGRPFEGVDARLSRYAYLVSLFPVVARQALGVDVKLRRRRVSSYTPSGDTGLLIARGERGDAGVADRRGWGYRRVRRLGAVSRDPRARGRALCFRR